MFIAKQPSRVWTVSALWPPANTDCQWSDCCSVWSPHSQHRRAESGWVIRPDSIPFRFCPVWSWCRRRRHHRRRRPPPCWAHPPCDWPPDNGIRAPRSRTPGRWDLGRPDRVGRMVCKRWLRKSADYLKSGFNVILKGNIEKELV